LNMVGKNSIYTKLYDRYSRYFIQHFCAARKAGHNRKFAFSLARIKLQDLIINELPKNKKQSDLIISAYSQTKKDQQLYERAIDCYRKYENAELGKE
jgi:hypothetical protein